MRFTKISNVTLEIYENYRLIYLALFIKYGNIRAFSKTWELRHAEKFNIQVLKENTGVKLTCSSFFFIVSPYLAVCKHGFSLQRNVAGGKKVSGSTGIRTQGLRNTVPVHYR